MANNETCPNQPLYINLNEDYELHLSSCPIIFQILNGNNPNTYRLQNPDGLFFRPNLI